MNDFDYDALQKKRIARGAYHKKNGSKSKGCTLPSDYLTAAQKRKLNGEVKTLELNRPIRREEYCAMTDDEKKQYLEFLIERYKPAPSMIAEMIGYFASWGKFEFKRLGLKSPYGNGRSPGVETRVAWAEFCRGTREEPVKAEWQPMIENIAEQIKDNEPVSEPVTVKRGDIQIVGTPRDVMNMLSVLCGTEQREFRVSFGA